MKKIVTIHQPEFLPWAGFFNKLDWADVYVVFDTVQFRRHYFQNRNLILTTKMGAQWITVPVMMKGHTDRTIVEMKINTEPRWKRKMLHTIQHAYQKHPFYEDVYPGLEQVVEEYERDSLANLNVALIGYITILLGINVDCSLASTLDLIEPLKGTDSALILNLCERQEATHYLSGPHGQDYLDIDAFKDAGIEVLFQEYKAVEYEQYKQEIFTANLSVIDLLMNYEGREALRIIREGAMREPWITE